MQKGVIDIFQEIHFDYVAGDEVGNHQPAENHKLNHHYLSVVVAGVHQLLRSINYIHMLLTYIYQHILGIKNILSG